MDMDHEATEATGPPRCSSAPVTVYCGVAACLGRVRARLEPVGDGDPGGERTFLERLDTVQYEALEAIGTRRRYPDGATLFFVDEAAHEVLVLLDGEVKAVIPARNGREVILGVRGPGDVLGELAAIDGGVRSATLQALGPVDVLAIRLDEFDAYLDEHPEVLRHLLLVVGSRLRASNRRQLEFGTGDSLGRLCARLVELADRYGETDDDGRVRITSPLTQADLGSLSGISREAVVKSMRALRSLGWITNEGPVIVILEADRLRERASA